MAQKYIFIAISFYHNIVSRVSKALLGAFIKAKSFEVRKKPTVIFSVTQAAFLQLHYRITKLVKTTLQDYNLKKKD
jgi:hypothetical protein